jgi:hypothetical protein
LLAVALLAGSAQAADYNLIGAGVALCDTWTASRHDHQATAYEQWVLGFLSGVGSAGRSNPLRGQDANAVWSWVDGYCQQYPFQAISDAALAFRAAHPR